MPCCGSAGLRRVPMKWCEWAASLDCKSTPVWRRFLQRSDSPGSDAQHGFGGDAYSIIRMDILHAAHPGVGVLDVDQPPGEWPLNDVIEAASDREAGAVAGDLSGPDAA